MLLTSPLSGAEVNFFAPLINSKNMINELTDLGGGQENEPEDNKALLYLENLIKNVEGTEENLNNVNESEAIRKLKSDVELVRTFFPVTMENKDKAAGLIIRAEACIQALETKLNQGNN